MAFSPAAIYLTHYSRVTELKRLADDLKAGIQAHEEIARRHEGDDVSALEDGVREYLYGRMDDHGCRADTAWREEIVGQDVKLNAQGLEVWLSRLARS
jgi:hypothetical protein